MNYDRFHKKLTLPLPMKGVERKIYLCVFLCILLGFVFSLQAPSWSYLDKSGSLIIIIGIWFTWKDFARNTGNYGDAIRTELQKLITLYQQNVPKGILASTTHNGKVEELKIQENEMRNLTDMMIKRLRLTEASILILGTFINGFGNIIMQLIDPMR